MQYAIKSFGIIKLNKFKKKYNILKIILTNGDIISIDHFHSYYNILLKTIKEGYILTLDNVEYLVKYDKKTKFIIDFNLKEILKGE